MKLTYDNPDLEKGLELFIADLPVTLKNGSSVEVSDEQAEAYRQRTGNTLEKALKGNDFVTLEKGGK